MVNMHRLRMFPSATALAAAVVIIAFANNVIADSISFGGGLALDNVTIIEVAGGEIAFLNAGGASVRRAVKDIEWIKVENVPSLTKAEEFIKDGKFKPAVTALKKAKTEAREKWLKTWIMVRTVHASDNSQNPTDAIDDYLGLVKSGVDVGFVARPPSKSILFLKANEKAYYLKAIDDAIKNTTLGKGAAKPYLDQLQVLVDQHDPEAAQAAIKSGNGNPDAIAKLIPKSATPMPAFMMRGTTDPITKLMMAGNLEEALVEIDKSLNGQQAGTLYKRLYQRGVCQLHLAEKTSDSKLFKDAGLSLMRVVVYSPRSPYAGPAYIEAGKVQLAIGRPDLARKLLDQATNYIDEKEEPGMFERLEKIKASLPQGG